MKSIIGFLITTMFLLNVVQAQTVEKLTCASAIEEFTKLVELKMKALYDPALAQLLFNFKGSTITVEQIGAGPNPTLAQGLSYMVNRQKPHVMEVCKLEGAKEAMTSLMEQLPQQGDNAGSEKEQQMN